MSAAEGAGRLAGKVALITGGAGNIGEVITRRFLDAGATVVITGRNSAKLEAYRARLLAELELPAARVLAVVMDGSDMVQVRTGVAQIVAQFGRVDVLVNNAGSAGARQRLPDIPLSRAELAPTDTETLLDGLGNLIGISWNLTRAVAPHMPPGSSIINISTIFSRTDYYGRIPYVVPKAALNALSMALANELGAQGIRVNLIYPGPIDSERIRTVFQRMDELKGQPAGSTATGFFFDHAAQSAERRTRIGEGLPDDPRCGWRGGLFCLRRCGCAERCGLGGDKRYGCAAGKQHHSYRAPRLACGGWQRAGGVDLCRRSG